MWNPSVYIYRLIVFRYTYTKELLCILAQHAQQAWERRGGAQSSPVSRSSDMLRVLRIGIVTGRGSALALLVVRSKELTRNSSRKRDSFWLPFQGWHRRDGMTKEWLAGNGQCSKWVGQEQSSSWAPSSLSPFQDRAHRWLCSHAGQVLTMSSSLAVPPWRLGTHHKESGFSLLWWQCSFAWLRISVRGLNRLQSESLPFGIFMVNKDALKWFPSL